VNRLVPFVAVGAVLAGACGVPAAQPLTAVRAAAMRDSVQATLDTFRRYSAAGQWDSLAALYANDADFRWLEQGVIQYRSAAQIREALRRASPTTRIETDNWDGVSHQAHRIRELAESRVFRRARHDGGTPRRRLAHPDGAQLIAPTVRVTAGRPVTAQLTRPSGGATPLAARHGRTGFQRHDPEASTRAPEGAASPSSAPPAPPG
jgi:hypothetical protein